MTAIVIMIIIKMIMIIVIRICIMKHSNDSYSCNGVNANNDMNTHTDTHLEDYNKVKEQMEKAAVDFKDFEKQDVKFTEDIA